MSIIQVLILVLSGALAGLIAHVAFPGNSRKSQIAALLVFIALFASLALLLTQFGVPALRAGLPWQTFTSTEAGFHVLVPAAPADEVQNIQTDAGPIPMRTFTAKGLDAQYVVAFADYPAAVVAAQTSETLLSSARDGSVRSLSKAVVSDERPVTLNGTYPGREYRADISDQGLSVVARIYLVKNRLYETLAIVPLQKATPADAQKFLDSFQLTP